jgi:DNA-binding MurR/RpiR family transcriptional regulator
MDKGIPLEGRVGSAFSSLSRSHRRVARFLLDNGLFAAFASAAELGDKVGVSAATVVRFCQAIGYDGYPELQAAVRAGLPTSVHKVQKMEQVRGALEKSQVAQRVFELDAQNLRRTGDALSQQRFQAAVAALGKASDILVVAGGLSAGPALYLAHSLAVMGLDARCVLNGGIPLALEVVRLKPSSALVGISVWRYVAETVQAMERARAVGATRIAITDSLVAPIAQRADYAFQVGTHGLAHSLSLTGMMALVNAFVAALSFQRPEATARALRHIDAAYRHAGLVLTE